ncbi:MAG: alkaline phosphatase family protein [Polaromonas sp.]
MPATIEMALGRVQAVGGGQGISFKAQILREADMTRKLLLTVMVFLQCVLLGCTVLTVTPSRGGEPVAFQAPQASQMAQAVKVVLVILENTNADEAHDPKYPFLWRLAQEGAYLSNYHAVAHPSQPNYVALVSGSTEGVQGDSPARLHRPHLGQKLASWMVYAEGYPGGACDIRMEIGRYARKHVPFLSFADVQDDPELCRSHITGFDAFGETALAHRLPGFSLVVPDLDHDAHDKPLRVADAWLEQNFGKLLDDAGFRRDVILIVVFDESGEKWPYTNHDDNRVYAALWGDHVIPGEVKTVHDHYDLLRTLEALFGLPPMSTGDGKAQAIGGILR